MGDCILAKKDRYNLGYAAGQLNPVNTGTYSASSRSSSIDMGVSNLYRYVNTNSVPNSNSSTYTTSSRSSSIDMGATNSYRYVNTSGIPSSITLNKIYWHMERPGNGEYDYPYVEHYTTFTSIKHINIGSVSASWTRMNGASFEVAGSNNNSSWTAIYSSPHTDYTGSYTINPGNIASSYTYTRIRGWSGTSNQNSVQNWTMTISNITVSTN